MAAKDFEYTLEQRLRYAAETCLNHPVEKRAINTAIEKLVSLRKEVNEWHLKYAQSLDDFDGRFYEPVYVIPEFKEGK